MTLTLEAGIKVTGDPQLLSNLNFVGEKRPRWDQRKVKMLRI